MKKITDGLYAFALRFIQISGFLLLLLLFAGGFFFTCYAEDMTTQLVLKRMDNLLWSFFGLALLLGAAYLVCRWAAGNYSLRKKILFWAVLCWTAALGLILVVFSKTVPAADAMSVYSAAESLAAGDTSVIHPSESYLSYYPQQVGLTLFYEGIIRLWKLLPVELPAYHIIKCLNVGLACLLIFFLYRSVQLLFADDRADVIFLVLAGGNIPLIMYTSFVYGEIPSITCFSAGLFCLLRLLRNRPGQTARFMPEPAQQPAADSGRHPGAGSFDFVLALLFFTLSVMLRKNSLILIVAALLVTFLEWLKTRRHILLAFSIFCAVCAFSVLPLVQSGLERRAGSSLKSGVPAISYLAMGMQESSRANGWYNGFNFNTYQETGMDSELTAARSREAISQRFSYFAAHPGYAAGFYRDKFLSQWADGTYACRQATLATFGGRRDFFQKLYDGPYSRRLIAYCNAYQNLLYLGALLFGFSAVKKKTRPYLPGLPLYLCLIGVLGGLLFHMLWEANARYIFPYGLLLLPYAARGISSLLGAIPPNPRS